MTRNTFQADCVLSFLRAGKKIIREPKTYFEENLSCLQETKNNKKKRGKAIKKEIQHNKLNNSY